MRKCNKRPLQYFSFDFFSWRYTLFLVIDANFKLKSKSRGLEDVELNPSWSYFVNDAGYKAHLLKHFDQLEVSKSKLNSSVGSILTIPTNFCIRLIRAATSMMPFCVPPLDILPATMSQASPL